KGGISIGRATLQVGQAPGDAQLFRQRQVMSRQEAARQVQGSRPGIGAKTAAPAIGRHEVEVALWLEQMVDAEPPAEMRQVRAAAHADMLTGVDQLTGRAVLKRASPSTQAR